MNQTRRWFSFVLWFLILVFRFVFGTRGAEPAFVMSLVDRVVTFLCCGLSDSSPELPDTLVVKRLTRAHEDVVTAVCGVETKLGRHLLVVADDVIHLFLRRAAALRGGALDVDAVFVSSG